VLMELPWRRKADSEKHGPTIFTNSYIDCPECGTRFEHHSGLTNEGGYLGCPNCNWGITDQEFGNGEYEDDIFGDEH